MTPPSYISYNKPNTLHKVYHLALQSHLEAPNFNYQTSETNAYKMARGNDSQVKVHYQGKDEDFIIFVDNPEAVKKWKADSSIPLAQVVSGFKVFVTDK